MQFRELVREQWPRPTNAACERGLRMRPAGAALHATATHLVSPAPSRRRDLVRAGGCRFRAASNPCSTSRSRCRCRCHGSDTRDASPPARESLPQPMRESQRLPLPGGFADIQGRDNLRVGPSQAVHIRCSTASARVSHQNRRLRKLNRRKHLLDGQHIRLKLGDHFPQPAPDFQNPLGQ